MSATERGGFTHRMPRCGATLAALVAVGCAGTTQVATPPREPPPVARRVLNTNDLAPPVGRQDGTLSPGRPVARTAMRRQLTSAVFSPDGKRIFAVSSHGELVAYDVASGALRGYARPWYDGTYPRLQVDRSGSRVLVVSPDRAQVLWDLRSDALRSVPPLPGATSYFVSALHPDGTAIARTSVSPEGHAVVITRLDEELETSVRLPGSADWGDDTAIRYSPSGARLALLTNGGRTFIYLNAASLDTLRTETLEPPADGDALTVDPRADVYDVAFRPQGGQVALGRPGRIELLDSLTAAVRADFPLRGSRGDVEYSADGRWLVASSELEIAVIEAETGRVSGRVLLSEHGLTEEDQVVVSTVLPGDGGFFANSPTGDAWHFDASGTAQPLPETAPRYFGDLSLLFSPDGAWQFLIIGQPVIMRVGETEPHMRFAEEGAQVSVWGADFSMDGRTLYVRSRNGVSRFGADGMRMLRCGNESPPERGSDGQLAQAPTHGGCLFDRDLRLSETQFATPDGRTIASFVRENVTVLHEGSSDPVRLNLGQRYRRHCFPMCAPSRSLAPDGSTIGFMDLIPSEGDVPTSQAWWEVYDARTGRLRAGGTQPAGMSGLIVFPGGGFALRGEASVALYDARGRRRLAFDGLFNMTTSNDLRILAIQTTDRVIHIVDTVTLRERETWTASSLLGLFEVTPDGLRIVAREEANAVVSSIDGSVQHRIPLWQDTLTVNFAGTFALTCDGGRALRVDTRSGERVDIAPCDGRPDAISEDGTLAVLTVGSSARVHRLSDGHVLTLETLIGPDPAVLVAYDDMGRWDLSHLDAENVRIRAAGPGDMASLDAPEAASRTDGLVGHFLRGE